VQPFACDSLDPKVCFDIYQRGSYALRIAVGKHLILHAIALKTGASGAIHRRSAQNVAFRPA
jgi:hypothetical protein